MKKLKKKRPYRNVSILGAFFAPFLFVLLFFAPAFAGNLAETVNISLNYGTATGLGTRDIREVIFLIVNVFFGFLAVIAVLIILYGGWVWMTSGGNAAEIDRAKRILRNAVIGLILIFSSYAIARFILNILVRATGPEGVACTIGDSRPCQAPGFPSACPAEQTCEDTDNDGQGDRWSDCQVIDPLDPQCADTNACNVTSIIPDDPSPPPPATPPLRPRNTVVQISTPQTFQATIDAQSFGIQRIDGAGLGDGDTCTSNADCLSDNCNSTTATCQGNFVSGTVRLVSGGKIAEFRPETNCPPPNASEKCFSENAQFSVTLNDSGGIQCTNGASLTCRGAVDDCSAEFRTGTVVDTSPPQISLQPTQICEGAPSSLQAQTRDDSGIRLVEFFDITSGNTSLGQQLGSGISDIWETYSIRWTPPSSYTQGETISISAQASDMDANTSQDTRSFTVVAGSCCNGRLDGDEEGIDCGGSCQPCGEGPPIIDYISPATDVSGNNDPANPSTYDDDVPHGTADNLVTIFGRNFGSVRGEVEFSDGSGGWLKAVLPSLVNDSCQDTWTDTVILAVVPPGVDDGPVRVIEATKGVCSQDSSISCSMAEADPCLNLGAGQCQPLKYLDATNDQAPGERRIPDFVEDGQRLPGICRIDPHSGSFREIVGISGIQFGDYDANTSKVKFGNFLAVIESPDQSWQEESISNIEVPNLAPGEAWVTVQIGDPPNISNAFPFTVESSEDQPIIIDFNPKRGDKGTYVTIWGRNFGNTAGEVYFNSTVSGGRGTPGNFDFPDACLSTFWTDTQIIVKAPAGAGDGPIRVVTADGKEDDTSDLSPFDFQYTGTVAPGLCRIDPPNGEQRGLVTLYGERFQTPSPVTRVTFYNGKVVLEGAISNFDRFQIDGEEQIQSRIHSSAQTGPVTVTNGADEESNPLNFTVGLCTSDASCSAGTVCCLAGDFQGLCKPPGECTGIPKVSAFGWSFVTGNLGPHVVEDCTVLNRCGLVCSEIATQNSGQACVTDDDCGGVARSCASPFSSPSPLYPRDGEVPVNSVITARFDQLMDTSTFTASNILVQRCQDGEDCDTLDFSTPAESISSYIWNYRGEDAHFFIFVPQDSLQPNSWYRVEITTEVKSAIGQEIVGNQGPGLGYVWKFKTRGSNEPGETGCVNCAPGYSILRSLTGPESTENLIAQAYSADSRCVLLNSDAFEWQWNSEDTAKVAVNTITTDSSNTAQARGETVPDPPVDITAKIQGTTDPDKAGICRVAVEFGVPRVIDKWPNCGSACMNASFGVVFSEVMDPRTLTAGNIRIYSCGSDMRCNDSSVMHNTGDVSGLRLLPNNNNPTRIEFEINSSHWRGNLIPGNYYRVTLSSNIQSQNGKPLELNFDDPNVGAPGNFDSYSWVFKTREDFYLCELSRVEVRPQELTTPASPPNYLYSARPFSTPDSCRPDGQPLNPYSVSNWGWSSNDPNIADLLTNTGFLARGGDLRDACGNGVLELGEQCDDGNTVSGDGCSYLDDFGNVRCNGLNQSDCTRNPWCIWASGQCFVRPCLNENDPDNNPRGGITDYRDASVCGNGRVEENEECDDGNTRNGDGCSGLAPGDLGYSSANRNIVGNRRCILEGSISGKSICGDGIIGPGESCETCGEGATLRTITGAQTCGDSDFALNRTPADRDGCSARCILEDTVPETVPEYKDGSDFSAPKSICGNGVIDPGEQCDDGDEPDNNDLDGCTNTCLLTGSLYEFEERSWTSIPQQEIGPFQFVSALNAGEAFISATADYAGNTKTGRGKITVTTAGGAPPGAGAGNFYIINYQPRAGNNCRNQNIVVTFNIPPDEGDLEDTTDGDGLFIEESAGSNSPWNSYNFTDPDRNTQIQVSGTRLIVVPNSNTWTAGNTYRVTFRNPGNISDAGGNYNLDCSVGAFNGTCEWEFSVNDEICRGAQVDVSPSFGIVNFNTWQRYEAVAYADVVPPRVDDNNITIGQGANLEGTLSCDADARVCLKYIGENTFQIYAQGPGGGNCPPDPPGNTEIVGLYPESRLQARTLLLGCGLRLTNVSLPAPGDIWHFQIIPSSRPMISGTTFEWGNTDLSDDQGDPAVWLEHNPAFSLPSTPPPYNAGFRPPYHIPTIPDINLPIQNPNHAIEYFLSVDPLILNYDSDGLGLGGSDPAGPDNNWDPPTGFRYAKVRAEVQGQPELNDTAFFYVGDICSQTIGSRTYGEIYPLTPFGASTFTANFDGTLRAKTPQGGRDPEQAQNIDLTSPGLIDITRADTLGQSLRVNSPDGRLAYSAQNVINPARGSLAFWTAINAFPAGGYVSLFEFSPGNPDTESISVRMLSRGNITSSYLSRGEGKTITYDASSAQLGQPEDDPLNWHFIVLTWNTTAQGGRYALDLKFYFDGEEQGYVNEIRGGTLSNLLPVTEDSSFFIANNNTQNSQPDAVIDEFEVRSDILTPAEVQARFLAGRACLAGGGADDTPNILHCTPDRDPNNNVCDSGAVVSCTNPLISITFDRPMDTETIFQTTAQGAYENIRLCEQGQCNDPANNLIARLSYNPADFSVSIDELISANTLSNNLELHYDFNENTISKFTNQITGVASGKCEGTECPEWIQDGFSGGAVKFSKDNTIEVDQIFTPAPNQPFTIGMWIKRESSSEGYIFSFLKGQSSMFLYLSNNSNQYSLISQLFDTNIPIWNLRYVIPQDEMKPDQWSHIALTYGQNNTVRLFVNGEQVAEQSNIQWGGTDFLDSSWYIGKPKKALSGDSFQGALDEVKIWSRALSDSEIKQLVSGSTLVPGQTYDVRVYGGLNGVKSAEGYPLDQNDLTPGQNYFQWSFSLAPDAQLCSCEKAVLRIQNISGDFIEDDQDVFHCQGDSCQGGAGIPPTDLDQIPNGGLGNDHLYQAQCYSFSDLSTPLNNQSLDFEWRTDDPQGVIQAIYWIDVNNNNKIEYNTQRQNEVYVTNSSRPGRGIVEVAIRGEGFIGGYAEDRVVVHNLACANPWPNDGIYDDSENSTSPDTNWSFWYCRDQGGEGFFDDLPAISETPTVRAASLPKEVVFQANYHLPMPLIQEYQGSDTADSENTQILSSNPACSWTDAETATWSYTFNFPESREYQLYLEVFNHNPNPESTPGNPADFHDTFNMTVTLQQGGNDITSFSLSPLANEKPQPVYVNLGFLNAGDYTIRIELTGGNAGEQNLWQENLAICRVGISELNQVNDVIGVKVFANLLNLSPQTWYETGVCKDSSGNPPDGLDLDDVCRSSSDCPENYSCEFNVPNRGSFTTLEVDGYPAIRSGRTVYVQAANYEATNLYSNLYSNIYLLSYNENAHQITRDIVEKLLNNWFFEGGIPNQTRGDEIRRDIHRIGRLQDLRLALRDFYRANGYYPLWDAVRGQAQGGTYLPGVSLSVWPSWTTTFAQSLGFSPPVDPINKMVSCPPRQCSSDGLCNADPKTCWDETSLRFACPDTPPQTNILGYINLDGSKYRLFYQFEYADTLGWDRGSVNDDFADSSQREVYEIPDQNGLQTICTFSSTPDDLDGDGRPDTDDNCNPAVHCPDNVIACANPDQRDTDGDGIGDACDTCPTGSDEDNDGICSAVDNCPNVFNPDQRDSDGNGDGDACDDICQNDTDGDGYCDEFDNCPFVYNPNQDNTDERIDGETWPNGVAMGDACDPNTDSDGDGYADGFCGGVIGQPQCNVDADCTGLLYTFCRKLPASTASRLDNCYDIQNVGQEDFDQDLIGYACDQCIDSDNDGITDAILYEGFENGTDGWELVTSDSDDSFGLSTDYRHLDDPQNIPLTEEDRVYRGVHAAWVQGPNNTTRYLVYRVRLRSAEYESPSKVFYLLSAWAKAPENGSIKMSVWRDCTSYSQPTPPGYETILPVQYRADCLDQISGSQLPWQHRYSEWIRFSQSWERGEIAFSINRNRAQDEVLIVFELEGQGNFYIDDVSLQYKVVDPRDRTQHIYSCGQNNFTPPDNCTLFNNPQQKDFDKDNIGDLCDLCTDRDGDGVGDAGYDIRGCPASFTQTDNCPITWNPDQGDFDQDASRCDFSSGIPYVPQGVDPRRCQGTVFDPSVCDFCGGDACDLDADSDSCYNWEKLAEFNSDLDMQNWRWETVLNAPNGSQLANREEGYLKSPQGDHYEETWLSPSGDLDLDGFPDDCDGQVCGDGVIYNPTITVSLKDLQGLERISVYERSRSCSRPDVSPDSACGVWRTDFYVGSEEEEKVERNIYKRKFSRLLDGFDEKKAVENRDTDLCDLPYEQTAGECYDIFFSDQNGSLDVNGQFITIQAYRYPFIYPGEYNYTRGNNIDGVELYFENRESLWVDQYYSVKYGIVAESPNNRSNWVYVTEDTANLFCLPGEAAELGEDCTCEKPPLQGTKCTRLGNDSTSVTVGFDLSAFIQSNQALCSIPESGVQMCEECDSGFFLLGGRCADYASLYPISPGSEIAPGVKTLFVAHFDGNTDAQDREGNPVQATVEANIRYSGGLDDSMNPALGQSAVINENSKLQYPARLNAPLYEVDAGSVNVWVRPNKAVNQLKLRHPLALGDSEVKNVSWNKDSWHMITAKWKCSNGSLLFTVFTDGRKLYESDRPGCFSPDQVINLKFWLYVLGLQVDDPTNPDFEVAVDELAIFSKELDQRSIDALYNAFSLQCLGAEDASFSNINAYMVQNYCAVCNNFQCRIGTLRTCLPFEDQRFAASSIRRDWARYLPENQTEFIWSLYSPVNTQPITIQRIVAIAQPGRNVGDKSTDRFTPPIGLNAPDFTVFVDRDYDRDSRRDQTRVWIPFVDASLNPGRGEDLGALFEITMDDNKNLQLENSCVIGEGTTGLVKVAVDLKGNAWVSGDAAWAIYMQMKRQDRSNECQTSSDTQSDHFYRIHCPWCGQASALEVDHQNNLWIVTRPDLSLTYKIPLNWIYAEVPLQRYQNLEVAISNSSPYCTLYYQKGQTGEKSTECFVYNTPYAREIALDSRGNAWIAKWADGSQIIYRIPANERDRLKTLEWEKSFSSVFKPKFLAIDMDGYLYVQNEKNAQGNAENKIVKIDIRGAEPKETSIIMDPPETETYGLTVDSQGYVWTMFKSDSNGDGKVARFKGSNKSLVNTFNTYSVSGQLFASRSAILPRSVLRSGLTATALSSLYWDYVWEVEGDSIAVGSGVSRWQNRWGKILYEVDVDPAGEKSRIQAEVSLANDSGSLGNFWISVDKFNSRIGLEPLISLRDALDGKRGEIVGKYLRLRFTIPNDLLGTDLLIHNIRITCRSADGRNICQ